MEFNNNYNKDEIIEFPDNYEEIANLALLNFEQTTKIDLNKLIKKGLEQEQSNINENNNIDNTLSKNEEEWGDDESGDENNNLNSYQKFEDDDYSDKEGEENIIKEISNNIQKNIINDNNKDKEINKIMDKNSRKEIINENIQIKPLKVNNKLNKKLSNEEMKKLVSKIEYTPPNWARNLTDQEFINKVKLYSLKNINNKI